RRLCRQSRGRASRGNDYSDFAIDELRRQSGQPVVMAFRPAKFDRDVASLGISGFAETPLKSLHATGKAARRFGAEISDDRHSRRLRARRDWRDNTATTEK